jgi:hypothetical protein
MQFVAGYGLWLLVSILLISANPTHGQTES